LAKREANTVSKPEPRLGVVAIARKVRPGRRRRRRHSVPCFTPSFGLAVVCGRGKETLRIATPGIGTFELGAGFLYRNCGARNYDADRGPNVSPYRRAQAGKKRSWRDFLLAIEDFGSGHSSMSNLTAAEFNTVKVDPTVVDGLAKDQMKIQLVGAIIAVAHPLGYQIVAEGIEAKEDADVSLALGCNLGQGWLFGKPMNCETALARFGRPETMRYG